MSSERSVGWQGKERTRAFHYPPSGNGDPGPDSPGQTAVAWLTPDESQSSDTAGREKETFERGLREGEGRSKAAFEVQLNEARAAITTAVTQFKSEREAYFRRVEPEAVQLALAIARKILHREAQIDPLLLTGMVHVALDKIEAGTRVRLRAHPADIRFWSEYFSQQAGATTTPDLIGDPGLQRGECALETEFGSTQVSLDLQLKDIEQGFLDLLEQRPQVR